MKPCRYCDKLFIPTAELRFFCCVKCREIKQHNDRLRYGRAYDAANKQQRLAQNSEYCKRPDIRIERYERKRSEEYKERRRKTRQKPKVKAKERVAFAEWQARNRERRSIYMLNWDRRNQAIKWAKEDFSRAREFKLVRTRPVDMVASFWRGIPNSVKIAPEEETVAFFEFAGNMWHITAPANTTAEIRKLVDTLKARENRLVGTIVAPSMLGDKRLNKQLFDKDGEFKSA
jgi:hypothetical protein